MSSATKVSVSDLALSLKFCEGENYVHGVTSGCGLQMAIEPVEYNTCAEQCETSVETLMLSS